MHYNILHSQFLCFKNVRKWCMTHNTNQCLSGACATEAVYSGLIPGRFKTETRKIDIHSFLFAD